MSNIDDPLGARRAHRFRSLKELILRDRLKCVSVKAVSLENELMLAVERIMCMLKVFLYCS